MDPILTTEQYNQMEDDLLKQLLEFIDNKMNSEDSVQHRYQIQFEESVENYLHSILPKSDKIISTNAYTYMINNQTEGRATSDSHIHQAISSIFQTNNKFSNMIEELKTIELQGFLRKYIWISSLTSKQKIKQCMFRYI